MTTTKPDAPTRSEIGSGPVSVIIVSRGRPNELAMCLTAMALQDHLCVEIIVVADPAGLAATGALQVKRVAFDEGNIAAARNAGIVRASGRIVAFIDDDAVPEPTWLSRLTQPFDDPAVAAAGGFVRGRNGISFQWQASSVDIWGDHKPLPVARTGPSLQRGTPGFAVRTEGTNAAFRRDILVQMGGFDPAYHFYMDDTDLNLRLAAAGHVTAIVPGAQVMHGIAASARRRSNRVPVTLYDIGASSAVFWRRHAGGLDPAPALTRLRAEQRARAIRHMISGGLEPGDVAPLMQTLEAGLVDGRARPLAQLMPLKSVDDPFLQFPSRLRPGRLLAGRFWQARRLRRTARQIAGDAVVTLVVMWPGFTPHRVRFNPSGFWEQTGGLFGRSDRSGPRILINSFRARLAREKNRLSGIRPIGSQ